MGSAKVCCILNEKKANENADEQSLVECDVATHFLTFVTFRWLRLTSASTRWCCHPPRPRWWRRARASPCSSSTRWGRPRRRRPDLRRWISRANSTFKLIFAMCKDITTFKYKERKDHESSNLSEIALEPALHVRYKMTCFFSKTVWELLSSC